MSEHSAPVWGGIVVAAGRSERFGPTNKLLEALCGRTIVEWSILSLAADPRIQELIVVVPPTQSQRLQSTISQIDFNLKIRICDGGSTRSGSVHEGLSELSASITHVAVHDAARPLASRQLVKNVLDEAEHSGASAPALQVAGTIGIADIDGTSLVGHLERSRLRELQTPQASLKHPLIRALNRFPNETDETSALYRTGIAVTLVPGECANMKITLPEDLEIARALAANRLSTL